MNTNETIIENCKQVLKGYKMTRAKAKQLYKKGGYVCETKFNGSKREWTIELTPKFDSYSLEYRVTKTDKVYRMHSAVYGASRMFIEGSEMWNFYQSHNEELTLEEVN